jgi:hypothetical protein
MDPQIQGALLGVGGAAVGGFLTLFGARAQATAAVRAVCLQVRGQRLDGLWQMRRDAHADFLVSVENARAALQDVRVQGAALVPGDQVTEGRCSAARGRLGAAEKQSVHGLSAFMLSVGSVEANSAQSLASVIRGVIRDADGWMLGCQCRILAVTRRRRPPTGRRTGGPCAES